MFIPVRSLNIARLPSIKLELNKYAKNIRIDLLSKLKSEIADHYHNSNFNYIENKENISSRHLFVSLNKSIYSGSRFIAEKVILTNMDPNWFKDNLEEIILNYFYAKNDSGFYIHPKPKD